MLAMNTLHVFIVLFHNSAISTRVMYFMLWFPFSLHLFVYPIIFLFLFYFHFALFLFLWMHDLLIVTDRVCAVAPKLEIKKKEKKILTSRFTVSHYSHVMKNRITIITKTRCESRCDLLWHALLRDKRNTAKCRAYNVQDLSNLLDLNA